MNSIKGSMPAMLSNMFWLNKPYSLSEIRRYLAFSGLEATTDQHGRVVVYDVGGGSADEMLRCIIEQNHLNIAPIPCNEQTELFVQNKLRTVCG